MIDYLTTHDIVWVNNTVTGKVNPFDYIRLESAMAGQYQYGNSTDVLSQSATFLERLLLKPAFADGNRRTALIATLTFLNANGYATVLNDTEAAELIRAIERREKSPQQAIVELVAPAQNPLGKMTLRKLITHECNHHVEALKHLAAFGD